MFLSDRVTKLIDHCLPKRGAFTQLAQDTGISAPAWNHVYHGRNKPTGEQLEQLCKLFPSYTLWLMTGQTNESAGQTSPDIEQLRKLEKRVSGE
jgi:hypothetical protein